MATGLGSPSQRLFFLRQSPAGELPPRSAPEKRPGRFHREPRLHPFGPEFRGHEPPWPRPRSQPLFRIEPSESPVIHQARLLGSSQDLAHQILGKAAAQKTLAKLSTRTGTEKKGA
jgi:hypothetical protein